MTRVSKDSDPEGNQGSYVKMDDGSKHTYSIVRHGDVNAIAPFYRLNASEEIGS